MKKLIIYLAILGLAAPALAGARTEASVNASSTIKLGPVIKKINLDARGDASTTVKARVEQIKSAISEHKGEIKEKARGRWGEKAQMHLGNILEHFDRSVDKLENASMRLETQIGKLKVQGLAMASSTDLLARAGRSAASGAIPHGSYPQHKTGGRRGCGCRIILWKPPLSWTRRPSRTAAGASVR
ncbi:MAG: hypothetical protein UY84_C0001G0112 [Candidatus Adlerbacteria bacterium GW2011_GWA2_54_12]|nr:MAG: hypothetical protein UY84_C0001G0112 [Candidatus Adlerbacteria bacterium GW2011_GWA2_54_12]